MPCRPDMAGNTEILAGMRQGSSDGVHFMYEGVGLLTGSKLRRSLRPRCQVVPVIEQCMQCRCRSDRGLRQVV